MSGKTLSQYSQHNQNSFTDDDNKSTFDQSTSMESGLPNSPGALFGTNGAGVLPGVAASGASGSPIDNSAMVESSLSLSGNSTTSMVAGIGTPEGIFATYTSRSAGVGTGGSGISITVNYDSSTSTAPTAFFTDVNAVVNFITSVLNPTNTVNLTVNVGYGEVAGTTMAAGNLGQSNYNLHSYSYATVKNALASHDPSITFPSSDPVSGTHTWWVGDTEGQALGIFNSSVTDSMGFAMPTNATFDYDRSNGITAGDYDFIGTVAHEFTEVLGRQLGVQENDINNAPSDFALDLLHYSSSGVRDFSRGGYFSADNGATNMGNFNTLSSGDSGDWDSTTPLDSYLAFSDPGVYNNISLNDLIVMQALGYNMTDDYSNSPLSPGVLAVNSSSTGTINSIGDADWFRVRLIAGTSYRFDEQGSPTGNGTLPDSVLALYNSSSVQLTSDDDTYSGGTFVHDSEFFYTPTTTGFYYVSAGAFSTNTGTYRVSVTTDDFSSNLLTTGHVAVGGGANGSIETSSDTDWFAVSLTAGSSYIIREDGSFVGLGTLNDTFLRLYNSAGTLLTSNDDSGPNVDSLIDFTATSTSTYYVSAGAFSSNTGSYQISVQLDSQPQNPDFNANGTGDILLSNGAGLGDWIIANNTLVGGGGIGSFPAGYHYVGTGDFIGNRTSDILLEDSVGGLGYWRVLNGAFAGGGGITNLPAGWSVAGTGDFNGDGTTDILIQNGAVLGDWLVQGATVTSGAGIGGLPAGWSVVGTGDFNGGGTTDVLIQDGPFVGYWKINNGTYNGGGAIATLPAGWSLVGTGDFNGDGTTDLLVEVGTFLYDWTVKNGALQSANAIAPVPTGWSLDGVGDFNGDGTSDLLLQSGTTLGVWQIHNGTLQSAHGLQSLPVGWSVVPQHLG